MTGEQQPEVQVEVGKTYCVHAEAEGLHVSFEGLLVGARYRGPDFNGLVFMAPGGEPIVLWTSYDAASLTFEEVLPLV